MSHTTAQPNMSADQEHLSPEESEQTLEGETVENEADLEVGPISFPYAMSQICASSLPLICALCLNPATILPGIDAHKSWRVLVRNPSKVAHHIYSHAQLPLFKCNQCTDFFATVNGKLLKDHLLLEHSLFDVDRKVVNCQIGMFERELWEVVEQCFGDQVGDVGTVDREFKELTLVSKSLTLASAKSGLEQKRECRGKARPVWLYWVLHQLVSGTEDGQLFCRCCRTYFALEQGVAYLDHL